MIVSVAQVPDAISRVAATALPFSSAVKKQFSN